MDVRVVSMPCMDIFEEQSEEYKAKVLPKNVRKRVAVEALSGFGWDRYVGLDGDMIGMNRFGASAPYSKLFPYFGFTVENVVARAIVSCFVFLVRSEIHLRSSLRTVQQFR